MWIDRTEIMENKMKKILTACLVTALALTVTACTSQENRQVENPPKVIFVTAAGGLNDGGQNDDIYEACSDAAREYGADMRCLESKTGTDVAANVEAASDDLPAAVVTSGADGAKAVETAAKSHKDINYIVLDTKVKADNVSSLIFSNQDAAFLAGVAAADKSSTGKVGIIMDKSTAQDAYYYGFTAGAETGKAGTTVTQVYVTAGGTDTDGMNAAKKLSAAGCDIVFTTTHTGQSGVLRYAELKDMKVITVSRGGEGDDEDDDDNSALMGAVETDIEDALNEEIRDAVKGRFSGGVKTFGLKGDMVSFEGENGFSDSDENAIERWEHKIMSGKIDVPATKAEFAQFDPSEFRK